MKPAKPRWQHPLNTREGRIERAIWTFHEGERKRMQVAHVIYYLKERQHLSDEEISIALSTAASQTIAEREKKKKAA